MIFKSGKQFYNYFCRNRHIIGSAVGGMSGFYYFRKFYNEEKNSWENRIRDNFLIYLPSSLLATVIGAVTGSFIFLGMEVLIPFSCISYCVYKYDKNYVVVNWRR